MIARSTRHGLFAQLRDFSSERQGTRVDSMYDRERKK